MRGGPMWTLVIEPFVEFDFLRRALIEAILLGCGFSIVGMILITRRLALIGDTLSHAMLPGVVLAFLIFGTQPVALFLGGWITGFLLLAVSFIFLRRRREEADSVLALFAVFSVSVGILIASRSRTTTEILALLFGNILAVDQFLLMASAFVTALTWLLFLWHYRALLIALIDPDFYRGLKKPSVVFIGFLLALFSANLTVGFASLGAMMTVGLLIVPPMVGRLWGQSLWQVVTISSLYSAFCSWVGILISYHGEVPSGPAIVAVACAGLAVLRLLRGVWR